MAKSQKTHIAYKRKAVGHNMTVPTTPQGPTAQLEGWRWKRQRPDVGLGGLCQLVFILSHEFASQLLPEVSPAAGPVTLLPPS